MRLFCRASSVLRVKERISKASVTNDRSRLVIMRKLQVLPVVNPLNSISNGFAFINVINNSFILSLHIGILNLISSWKHFWKIVMVIRNDNQYFLNRENALFTNENFHTHEYYLYHSFIRNCLSSFVIFLICAKSYRKMCWSYLRLVYFFILEGEYQKLGFDFDELLNCLFYQPSGDSFSYSLFL